MKKAFCATRIIPTLTLVLAFDGCSGAAPEAGQPDQRAGTDLRAAQEAVAVSDIPPPAEGDRTYAPYPEKSFPNNVYFGETHLHTSFSTDAGMVGNTPQQLAVREP